MKPTIPVTGAAAQQTTEIVVYINTIDDIYSDFDPRKIDARILSADFINEVRLQGQQSTDGSRIEVNIFAPRFIRQHELTRKAEKITRRRIRRYFEEEYRLLRSDWAKSLARGLVFLVSGLTCFFIAKLVGDPGESHFILKILLELITFFSWFATWNGITTFGDLPKQRELRLRRRLADAQIHFKFVKDITAINPV
jgi:hypothetical protein